MSTHKNKKPRVSPRQWLGSASRRLADYLKHHWSSTVFVTACVTILHVGTSWLDAFDAYSYVWVGNIVSEFNAATPGAPRVAVVEIDDADFDNGFARRSPLNRDRLHAILADIYAADPALVVIDLDLAPASPEVLSASERAAEAAIGQLILDGAGRSDSPVSTVLLEPWTTMNPALQSARDAWRKRLAGADGGGRITFAHGYIPQRFGMSNWYYKDKDSLFAQAKLALASDPAAESQKYLVARAREMIDPRAYTGQLQVISTSQSAATLQQDIRAAFGEITGSTAARNRADRVVYFGGAYGGDDLFATPLGRLYGVELHAAAYASCWPARTCAQHSDAWKRAAAILLDLLTAIVTGHFITRCWRQYLEWRTHSDPEVSAVAGLAAFKLMCFVLLGLLVLVAVAGLVLARWGIWLAPIPIAIGMFVDAWIVGPIARHDARAPRVAADAAAPAAVPGATRVPLLLGLEISAQNFLQVKRIIFWLVVGVGMLLYVAA